MQDGGGGGGAHPAASLELPLRCGPVKVVKTVYGYKVSGLVLCIYKMYHKPCPPNTYNTNLYTHTPHEMNNTPPKQVRDKKTARITDVVELSLPPMEYDTQALWTELPGTCSGVYIYMHT